MIVSSPLAVDFFWLIIVTGVLLGIQGFLPTVGTVVFLLILCPWVGESLPGPLTQTPQASFAGALVET